MSTLALTLDARIAMLSTPGLLARLDEGGAASVEIYGSDRPGAAGDASTDPPLVVLVLATPCGNIDPGTGVVTLVQADSTGDMIATSGAAVWGRLVAGDGVAMADGDATNGAGAGPFKLTGTTGTDLFAGARAELGAVALS